MQNNTFSRLFVGQNIVRLKRVDSTNNFLKNELSKSTPLPEGTVILAEEQYAGRGQVSNIWYSEPFKNLTISLLLLPTFINPEKQFLLNQSISLAINDTLSTIIGDGIKIKWPNDIYYYDEKVGGVLIENILRGNIWKQAIVGIGLNINQVDFPADVNNVTSLKKILHQDYDIADVLNHLCKSIEQRYLQLRAGKFDLIISEYNKRLYRLNNLHQFKIEDELVEGEILGVDNNGRLEISVSGKLRKFNFKEVAFVI